MPESKEKKMESSNLPKMTDEQRKAALERSAEARRERMEFLMCIPGIGKAKADDIMRKLGIAENRRVQGLGSRQLEGIVELVAKLK